MPDLAVAAIVTLIGVTAAWVRYGLPSIVDRYRPAPVPGGWDADQLVDLRAFFTELYDLTERVIDGQVVEAASATVVDDLGEWCPAEHAPAQPALYEAVASEQPVAWDWDPAWLRTLQAPS